MENREIKKVLFFCSLFIPLTDQLLYTIIDNGPTSIQQVADKYRLLHYACALGDLKEANRFFEQGLSHHVRGEWGRNCFDILGSTPPKSCGCSHQEVKLEEKALRSAFKDSYHSILMPEFDIKPSEICLRGIEQEKEGHFKSALGFYTKAYTEDCIVGVLRCYSLGYGIQQDIPKANEYLCKSFQRSGFSAMLAFFETGYGQEQMYQWLQFVEPFGMSLANMYSCTRRNWHPREGDETIDRLVRSLDSYMKTFTRPWLMAALWNMRIFLDDNINTKTVVLDVRCVSAGGHPSYCMARVIKK
jgi:hypothetical protein